MATTEIKKQEIKEALRDLPGAAVDAADDEKVTPQLVDERTATLNCNPRNDGRKI